MFTQSAFEGKQIHTARRGVDQMTERKSYHKFTEYPCISLCTPARKPVNRLLQGFPLSKKRSSSKTIYFEIVVPSTFVSGLLGKTMLQEVILFQAYYKAMINAWAASGVEVAIEHLDVVRFSKSSGISYCYIFHFLL